MGARHKNVFSELLALKTTRSPSVWHGHACVCCPLYSLHAPLEQLVTRTHVRTVSRVRTCSGDVPGGAIQERARHADPARCSSREVPGTPQMHRRLTTSFTSAKHLTTATHSILCSLSSFNMATQNSL